MPLLKRVLGLDLGSHAIKAVELRQTVRGLEPVQLQSQPRIDGESGAAEPLSRLARVHQLSMDYVVCSLPGDRVSTRQLDFPFRERKKLEQTVPFELEGEVPFELADILIDFEVLEADSKGSSVIATLVQRREVAELLADLASADCDPRILEAEGMVLANLSSVFDLGGIRLLVDLGHRKTTFCLVVDGRALSARSITAGGRALTEALSKDLDIPFEEAEQRKCEEGIFDADLGCSSPKALAVLDQIAREIRRSLESAEGATGELLESRINEVTLMGGGARLHRIADFLGQRAGLPTALLETPSAGEHAALLAGGDPLLYAPALALALRAGQRRGMNFRREEFSYRTDFSQLFGRDMRTTGILACIAAVLLLTSSIASLRLEARQAGEIKAQMRQLYAESFPDQGEPDNPLAAMNQALTSARERADFLGVYGGNRSALDLLTELSNRIPADLQVVFDEVNIDPKAIRLKVEASTFEAVDRVLNELRGEEPFGQAKVSGEVVKTKDGKITFTVSVPLEASAGGSS